jgi:hypothetical protein
LGKIVAHGANFEDQYNLVLPAPTIPRIHFLKTGITKQWGYMATER